MELRLCNRVKVSGTLVADEFIDRYMADANGEYVKVYLYLLRHEREDVDVTGIADALNHTESDVKRALSYWKRMGVLCESLEGRGPSGTVEKQSQGQKRSLSPANPGSAHNPGETKAAYRVEDQGAAYSVEGQGAAYRVKDQGTAYNAEGQGAACRVEDQGAACNAEGQGAAYRVEDQGAAYSAEGQEAAYRVEDQGAAYSAEGQGAAYRVEDRAAYGVEGQGAACDAEEHSEAQGAKDGGPPHSEVRAQSKASCSEANRQGSSTHSEVDGRNASSHSQAGQQWAAACSEGNPAGAKMEAFGGSLHQPKEQEEEEVIKERKVPGYPIEEMNRLADDEDFSQLLYIAQKYLNKVFTQRDCEIFGYLYGKLHMSAELLEYLVEYCAQIGHTSIRYIETVALNWYEKKLLTVEAAKTYSRSFSKDTFAVMKAFGLTDRRPGEVESAMIDKWFKCYGFTRDIIVEACNRTMTATHNPSFQYADKILLGWKKAGVRALGDIAAIDAKRQEASQPAAGKDSKRAREAAKGKKTANRFHNFEQNSYDYDEMVWNMMKEQ